MNKAERIAEIKRVLRIYGMPIGRRVYERHAIGTESRVVTYEANLCLDPQLIEGALQEGFTTPFTWVSLTGYLKYGTDWLDAWEKIYEIIRDNMLAAVDEIEAERGLKTPPT